MNLAPLLSRRLACLGAVIIAAGLPAADTGLSQFKRIEPQYIAALTDPQSTSGNNASSWGLWTLDPGPRGYELDRYDQLKAAGGITPAKWQFDAADWWLEEHGLIMEKPAFPLPPGRYLVTGGRQATAVLTVSPKDKNGQQKWKLSDGATIYDVTHLGCRAARYTPAQANGSCSPQNVPARVFPMNPGKAMPPVKDCRQQEYAVLIVIGLPATR
jgi:hypothetical protein